MGFITMIAATSQVLVIHNSLPVKTVREFIAYAKKHPGELNYSSAGNGSQPHLTAEMFKYFTGETGIRLGKFVIPNPFGPYEEPRFTAYLAKSWYEGKTPTVSAPATTTT